jgi:hypothetical protein
MRQNMYFDSPEKRHLPGKIAKKIVQKLSISERFLNAFTQLFREIPILPFASSITCDL